MNEETGTKKALQQHLEMEMFFTGDFAVKGPCLQGEVGGGADEGLATQDHEARMELEKIAKEIGKCCQCGLGESRTNGVPGEGNPNAQLVFVGEAPGADEDAQGRPFVGRAGQLLEKIINAMGLRREDVFICNILKCRPPDNRDPKPDEITKCLPFLQRQLDAIAPEIIVALGAHAACTLLETKKPIGQLRGRFHQYYTSNDAEPIKFMPTYHPAYLLRNYSPDNRRKVWEDMQKVMAELGLEAPKSGKK